MNPSRAAALALCLLAAHADAATPRAAYARRAAALFPQVPAAVFVGVFERAAAADPAFDRDALSERERSAQARACRDLLGEYALGVVRRVPFFGEPTAELERELLELTLVQEALPSAARARLGETVAWKLGPRSSIEARVRAIEAEIVDRDAAERAAEAEVLAQAPPPRASRLAAPAPALSKAALVSELEAALRRDGEPVRPEFVIRDSRYALLSGESAPGRRAAAMMIIAATLQPGRWMPLLRRELAGREDLILLLERVPRSPAGVRTVEGLLRLPEGADAPASLDELAAGSAGGSPWIVAADAAVRDPRVDSEIDLPALVSGPRPSPAAARPALEELSAELRVELGAIAADLGPAWTAREVLERLAEASGSATAGEFAAWFARATPASHASPRTLGVNHTEFRRYSGAWPKLEQSLRTTIRARLARGERRLVLLSIGGSDGAEAYSLAAAVERLLREPEFQEDPAAWDVTIRVFDFNPLNLLAATEGVVGTLNPPSRHDQERGRLYWEDLGRFDHVAPSRYRAPEMYRRWVQPRWIDLNDPAQLDALAGVPADAAMYMHVHYYLPPANHERNVEFLRRGGWVGRDGGFLSYTSGRFPGEQFATFRRPSS